jgi:transposase
MTTEKRNRPNYTREFKRDAVKLVIEQGYNSSEAGRRIGVSGNNIARWVREYRREKEDVAAGGTSYLELEAENRRLKKENRRLQMEREILKKAAAFFAKESD